MFLHAAALKLSLALGQVSERTVGSMRLLGEFFGLGVSSTIPLTSMLASIPGSSVP